MVRSHNFLPFCAFCCSSFGVWLVRLSYFAGEEVVEEEPKPEGKKGGGMVQSGVDVEELCKGAILEADAAGMWTTLWRSFISFIIFSLYFHEIVEVFWVDCLSLHSIGQKA